MQHNEVRHAWLGRRLGLGIQHGPVCRRVQSQAEGAGVEADGVGDVGALLGVVEPLVEEVADVAAEGAGVELAADEVDRVAEDEDADDVDALLDDRRADLDETVEDAAPVEGDDADDDVPQSAEDADDEVDERADDLADGARHPSAHGDDDPAHDLDEDPHEPTDPVARVVPRVALALLLLLVPPLLDGLGDLLLDPLVDLGADTGHVGSPALCGARLVRALVLRGRRWVALGGAGPRGRREPRDV